MEKVSDICENLNIPDKQPPNHIRKLHDDEQVIVVLVDLWAFEMAETVFQVERVEMRVSLSQALHVGGGWLGDIGPLNSPVREHLVGHGSTFR